MGYWRVCKTAIGVILLMIGLAGIPDDIKTWITWLSPYIWILDHWMFRLVVILIGLAVIYGATMIRQPKTRHIENIPTDKETQVSKPYDLGLKYLVKRLIEDGSADTDEAADILIKEHAFHGNLVIYGCKENTHLMPYLKWSLGRYAKINTPIDMSYWEHADLQYNYEQDNGGYAHVMSYTKQYLPGYYDLQISSKQAEAIWPPKPNHQNVVPKIQGEAEKVIVPAFIDRAKIQFIDAAFRQINDVCIPAYDRACPVPGSWRKSILTDGSSSYSNVLRTLRLDISETVRQLRKMAEDNKIFHDICSLLRPIADEHNRLIHVLGELDQRVKKLPEKPNNETLDLIESQAKEFRGGVGQYGQCLRKLLDTLVEVRRKEIGR